MMVGRILIKVLNALDLLARPQGATTNELAEHLGVDRRSVYRIRETMEALGIPLFESELSGKEKRWMVLDSYVKKLPNLTIPNTSLTLSEIVALYLLKNESGLFAKTEIGQRIDSAFRKIDQMIPKGLGREMGKISGLFVSCPKCSKDYSGKEHVIDACTEAMLQRKTCYVKYDSFADDEMKNFKIDPLCFFENNGGLYLFVNATTFDEIRTLAVERIQAITPTDSAFDPPKDFDPKALLGPGFYIVYDDSLYVKIWISADQARYVKERVWTKGQVITDQPDGSIILEMTTSGWWHVKKWVLSLGAEAKVLEPKKLGKAIADELKQALGRYTGAL
ncbi:MAG: WYL domain-containing protein [Syntrophobacteraceae bacterium]